MMIFFSFIHVVISIFLVISILLQSSKGGGLAGMFGGGMSGGFSSRGAATFLSKMTMYCAIGFAVTSMTIALINSRTVTAPKSAVQEVMEASPMDLIPAVPGGANDPLAMPGGGNNQAVPPQTEPEGETE